MDSSCDFSADDTEKPINNNNNNSNNNSNNNNNNNNSDLNLPDHQDKKIDAIAYVVSSGRGHMDRQK